MLKLCKRILIPKWDYKSTTKPATKARMSVYSILHLVEPKVNIYLSLTLISGITQVFTPPRLNIFDSVDYNWSPKDMSKAKNMELLQTGSWLGGQG